MGLGGAYICYIIFTLRMEFWYNDPATGSNAGFAILLGIATQVSRSFPPRTKREFNVFTTVYGVFHRRTVPTFPRVPAEHDLARQSRPDRAERILPPREEHCREWVAYFALRERTLVTPPCPADILAFSASSRSSSSPASRSDLDSFLDFTDGLLQTSYGTQSVT